MVNKKLAAYVLLAIICLLFAIKYTFFYIPKCETFGCFINYMKKCEGAKFVNDDIEATWKYVISGNKDKEVCEVEVTLLQPKSGELGIERLGGYSMTCVFQRGAYAYPERDLDKCHGLLKEEMQDIIIKKLHTYVINNLNRLDNNLEAASKNENNTG